MSKVVRFLFIIFPVSVGFIGVAMWAPPLWAILLISADWPVARPQQCETLLQSQAATVVAKLTPLSSEPHQLTDQLEEMINE